LLRARLSRPRERSGCPRPPTVRPTAFEARVHQIVVRPSDEPLHLRKIVRHVARRDKPVPQREPLNCSRCHAAAFEIFEQDLARYPSHLHRGVEVAASVVRRNNKSKSMRTFLGWPRRGRSAFIWLLLACSLPAQAQLVISELRNRGPSGANDEYVVIQNIGNSAHTVSAVSGTTPESRSSTTTRAARATRLPTVWTRWARRLKRTPFTRKGPACRR